MFIKEYRIAMPLSVEEYRIGQLYMISKHSDEQSEKGEGVEVVKNESCSHAVHGPGQYTEKRVHLSSRLPSWIQSFVPKIFYVTEKAWNFYPYTITEYTCSFLPRFSVHIETRYENNGGTSDNVHGLAEDELSQREVDEVDIVYDTIPEKSYCPEEDCQLFKSTKTGRGPLSGNWRVSCDPIMCSYKLVRVKFDVWGFQSRVESFTHKSIRDILLLGHKQAYTWIDEWIDMTLDDLRKFESSMHQRTNEKVCDT